MKVCIETHHEPSFGEIPEGSLWDDESPYLTDAAKFVDVLDDKPAPAKTKKVR